jgi:uncharacterized repeat protein (TIGR03803 family)
MRKRCWSKTIFMGCAFFAVTAIAACAQSFTSLASFEGTDGKQPNSPLVQGIDGNLYGTTATTVNAPGAGTFFRITPAGGLTTIYTFCTLDTTCTDGAQPAGILQGTNENFYGITQVGGMYGSGTVFEITPGGKLTLCITFVRREIVLTARFLDTCCNLAGTSMERRFTAERTAMARSLKSLPQASSPLCSTSRPPTVLPMQG